MPPDSVPDDSALLTLHALEALSVSLVVADSSQPDFPIIHVSPGFETLTGYARAEALGRNCRFLQGAETDAAVRAQMRQALAEGNRCRVCLLNYRKDGTPFWNELTLAPIPGGPLWAGVLSDVSAQEEAVRAQAADHARLSGAYARERHITETLEETALQITDIVESITDGFFAVDGAWRFTYLNREAEALLGKPRADLLGASVWDEFAESQDGPFHRQFAQAVRENHSLTFTEFDAPRRAWFEVHAYPTPDGLTVYLRDVTERREAQARQRAFVRDVLASVTDGKLRLCASDEELPPPGTPFADAVSLSRTEGLDTLRHRADEAAYSIGMSDDRRGDLVLAVGEAAMNAVTHAGRGVGTVSLTASGGVQIRVEDHGAGIRMENLPRATLEHGYTTTGTMGQGMKMMLQLLDRLWLRTGESGTTVVLEMDAAAPMSE